MKWIVLSIALWLGGCGKCQLASDCEPGQHCDFPTGECLDGCKGPDDCAPTARCDLDTGRCVPALLFPMDASTSTDAG